MPPLRTRRSVAFLCIAVLVFAAFVPTVSSNLFDAILTPLWLVFPAATVIVIRRKAARSDEQPVSLLSLIASRAPPARLPLA